MNLLGESLLTNPKHWKLSTVQVVGEGRSGSWGGAQTKVEVHECELTKNIFLCSNLLQVVSEEKTEDNRVLP